MTALSGKTFVLELGREIRFKAKQILINYLREQAAQISFILTASTDFVLVADALETYKTRRAVQLGIPLVNVQYIYECQKGISTVDIKRFFVTSAENQEKFTQSGTIPVPAVTNKPAKVDLTKIKIWNGDDVQLPQFDELTHAEIGEWAIFKETNDQSDVYFALELQIIPEEHHSATTNSARARFRYEKQTISRTHGQRTIVQYAFSSDIAELHHLFASYYSRINHMPRITRIREILPDQLGSKLLLRSLFLHRLETQLLEEDVCQLVESLWMESVGDLNQMLAVPPESLSLQTITEAEASLLEIKSKGEGSTAAAARFYSLIPHQSLFVTDLVQDRRALIEKIDLCQMLRDLLTVNELTNWNLQASIEAKYRALKCHIQTLSHDSQEYQRLCEMISSSTNGDEQVLVHQIYSVAKSTDALNFRSTLSNQKQLFHGSKYNHFLGILSRGLLMPKAVVDDLGITRTDIGCLGAGIYFSDSVSTSLKYTTGSSTRVGRRLLCISQVALGDSAKFYSFAPTLNEAPENFHSTHGVKNTAEKPSRFTDDEYVIYNLDQQRLLYLVEVSTIPQGRPAVAPSTALLPIVRETFTESKSPMIPPMMEDEEIQVAEQDYGLICPSSGQLIPLKAFHVRAQLVDITAEVVLYQVYHNTSSTSIEAKYVFPLDENCSVCGFEAHINNKVIKGVVKEKEQAKREYREAIEKGHGAYLMHQEQPEVFSVSVGNLPANCEVIIKITYVAELPIENNDIIFRLPAKVASWQSKQALQSKDQTLLPSIDLQSDTESMKSVQFSLKVSIRMPYEIVKIFSPTHRLRRKLTDCVAMIEMIDNVLLEKDFILSLSLKSVNLPRMLNETLALPDNDSQASMLTFYPKFDLETSTNDFVEMILMIDVSNSMDGKHVQQAKQLAHLFLTSIKPEETNVYFNIVTFGSDNDECFPISSPNNKENLDKAKHFVLHSLDHRGNTDLFTVLRRYSLLPSFGKSGRQFVVLSDGHINDLPSILSLLSHQPSMRHDRFFTCSIGDTSNKHQLKQLANGAPAGGLSVIFDSNYRSRWKSKVLQLLEHLRQPCVTNIDVQWQGTTDEGREVFTSQAPKIIRSLFNGMRLTVYRFIQNCHQATLTAKINEQEFNTTIFSNKMTESQGRILHCLTARAIIDDYEKGFLHPDPIESELIKSKYKQDLIDLSIKYSVVSSLTSFVAIEERDGNELEPGVRLLDVMLEHDDDLLPYIGWDGERTHLEIVKEKLVNGKRTLIGASLAASLELSEELESLCQGISYRAGGEEKSDLMFTLIDIYRSRCKLEDKARELERQMRRDLLEEIDHANAEERETLEKRLNAIDSDTEDESEEGWGDSTSPAFLAEMDGGAFDMYELCARRKLLSHLPRIECVSESEEDEDMGFDLFGGGGPTASAPISGKGIVDTKFKAESQSESEEDEAMGFDCFDGGGPATSLKMSKKKTADRVSKPQIESVSDDEVMGFDLFGGGGPKASVSISNKRTGHGVPKATVQIESVEDDDMGFGLFDDGVSTTSVSIPVERMMESESTKRDFGFPTQAMMAPEVPSSSRRIGMNGAVRHRKILSPPIEDPFAVTEEMEEAGEKQLQVSSYTMNAYPADVELGAHHSFNEPYFDSPMADDSFLSAPTYMPLAPTMDMLNLSMSYDASSYVPPPPPPPAPSFFSFGAPPQVAPPLFNAPVGAAAASGGGGGGGFTFGASSSQATADIAAFSHPYAPFSATTASPFSFGVPSPASGASFSHASHSSLSSAAAPSLWGKASDAPTPSTSNFFGGFQAGPPVPEAAHSYFGVDANIPLNPTVPIGAPGLGFSAPAAASFGFAPPLPPPPPPMFGVSSLDPASQPFVSASTPSLWTQPSAAPTASTSSLFGGFQRTRAPVTFGTTAAQPAPPPVPTSFWKDSAKFIEDSSSKGPTGSALSIQTVAPTTSTSSVLGDLRTNQPPLAFRTTAAPPAPPPVPTSFQQNAAQVIEPSSSTYIQSNGATGFPFWTPTAPPVFGAAPQLPMAPPTLKYSFNYANNASLGSPTILSAQGSNRALPNTVTASAFAGFQMPQAHFHQQQQSMAQFSRSIAMSPSYSPTSPMAAASPSISFPAPPPPPPPPPLPSSVSSTSGKQSLMDGLGAFATSMVLPKMKKGSVEVNREKSRDRDRDEPQIYDLLESHSCSIAYDEDVAEGNLSLEPKADWSALVREQGRCLVEYEHDAIEDDRFRSVNRRARKSEKMKSRMPTGGKQEAICDLLLLDVVPLSLGIEDIHGHMHTIISRNRTIPTKTSFYPVFTNAYADQTTAIIRVFEGEHHLTKYNLFLGEMVLTGLSSNLASRTLEIGIRMDLDANGIITVDAEEARSGARASLKITQVEKRLTARELENHIYFVKSEPGSEALAVANRQEHEPLFQLKGEIHQPSISFTGATNGFASSMKLQTISLTTTMMAEVKRIQLVDGSFALNEDLSKLLLIDVKEFEQFQIYLNRQGFSSLALNTKSEIQRLIGTGIFLIALLYQVPSSERHQLLVPFDSEQIRSICRRHLPQSLRESVDRAIDFYEAKRSRCGIYCEQLELTSSSWEKLIQNELFHLN